MSIPTFWPHPALQEFWESHTHHKEGATQPHVQALLYHLMCALGSKHAVELGVWKGATSRWLACAIAANGGGSITLVEVTEPDLALAKERVEALGLPNVEVRAVRGSSLDFLAGCEPYITFVFLDDDKLLVGQKLAALRTRLPHCVVAIHDVETLAAELLKAEGIVMLPVLHEPSSGSLGLVSW